MPHERTRVIAICCEALQSHRVIELNYGLFTREVEVHAVGWTAIGHPVARVWQLTGGAARGERTGWKLLRLDEPDTATLTAVHSAAPRRGYRRSDAGLERIICEL